MNIYPLSILVEPDEDGIFISSCPAFKGCHSYGKTIVEALDNLTKVIEICIAELQWTKFKN